MSGMAIEVVMLHFQGTGHLDGQLVIHEVWLFSENSQEPDRATSYRKSSR